MLGGRSVLQWRCLLPPKVVGKADLGGRLALFGSDGQCVCLRTAFVEWKMPDGELYFFLIKKEPADDAG